MFGNTRSIFGQTGDEEVVFEQRMDSSSEEVPHESLRVTDTLQRWKLMSSSGTSVVPEGSLAEKLTSSEDE